MVPSSFHLGALCLFTLYCLLLGIHPAFAISVLEQRQEANLTSSVGGTSKAGLGWPNGGTVSLKQFEGTGRVTWYYTWSVYPIDNNIEFVPMFWGNDSIGEWTMTAKNVLAQMTPKVTAVLGMNEPELANQANLTVDQGVELWKTYVEPLRAQGYRLGSPGPSSSPAGKTWLQAFITACNGECTIDFISTHWYGTNATQFRQHLEDYYATFQKPLWVTEWACEDYVNPEDICSLQDIITFMNTTQTYLDGASYVERYAWFGAQQNLTMVDSNNAIMDANGIINDLGKQYIDYDASVDGPIDTSLPTFTAAAGSPTNTLGSNGHTSLAVRSFPSALLTMTFVFALQSLVWLC